MKRMIVFLAATALAGPALAQHQGHAAPTDPHAGHRGEPKPAPADPQAGHDREPQPEAASDPHAGHDMTAQSGPTADPHAGHDMTPQPAPAADPHAGHEMSPQPQPATDPHVGHDMLAEPSSPADPHAGHDMGAMGASIPPAPPVAPPPPEAFSGPEHAADLVYGDAAMAAAREQSREEMGDIEVFKILVDRMEAGFGEGADGYALDAQGWYGGDIDKLWIKTEAEGAFGESPEQIEVQALWSHALDPWFDLQAGVRYDFRPDPERAYLVLGIQGLAPYWFEVDGALFLSEKGDLSARFEAEYDQRITQRLILQPRVEFDLTLQDVPEIGVGSGLSTAEAGLRLRYEFYPEASPAVIAPYVGVQYERAFGNTADFRRAAGEEVGGWKFLIGLRTWF